METCWNNWIWWYRKVNIPFVWFKLPIWGHLWLFLNWVTRIEFSHVTYVHMKLGILTNSKSILESVQSISGHHYSTLWVLNWSMCPSPYPNLCPCPWSERSILGVNFLSSGTSLVLVTSIISSIEFWLEQYIIYYIIYI